MRSRRRSRRTPTLLVLSSLIALFFLRSPLHAQSARPTHTFHDRATRLSIDYPADWTFAEQDHEISTFHLDARTAPRNARLRAVVAMPENPFPASTFSGAYVYVSVTPHTSAAACARQAVCAAHHRIRGRAPRRRIPRRIQIPIPDPTPTPAAGNSAPAIALTAKPDKLQIAGIAFTHGRDEQREVCITQHDDVYTTFRAGSCLRFDLAINNFCGGEVSGVRDITPRNSTSSGLACLTDILKTLRFDAKMNRD